MVKKRTKTTLGIIALVLVAVAFLGPQLGLFTTTGVNRDCATWFQTQKDRGLISPADAKLSLVPFEEFCLKDITSKGLVHKLVSSMTSGVSGGCSFSWNIVDEKDCPQPTSTSQGFFGDIPWSKVIFTIGDFDVTVAMLVAIAAAIAVLLLLM